MANNILPPKPPKTATKTQDSGFFTIEEPENFVEEPKINKQHEPAEDLTKDVAEHKPKSNKEQAVKSPKISEKDEPKQTKKKESGFANKLFKKKEDTREKEVRIGPEDLDNIRKALGITEDKKSIQKEFEEKAEAQNNIKQEPKKQELQTKSDEKIREALGLRKKEKTKTTKQEPSQSQDEPKMKNMDSFDAKTESKKLKDIEKTLNKDKHSYTPEEKIDEKELESIPVFDDDELKKIMGDTSEDEEKHEAEKHFDEMEKKAIVDLDELEKHLEEIHNKTKLTKTDKKKKVSKERKASKILHKHKTNVKKSTQKIRNETDKIKKEQQKNKKILQDIKKQTRKLENLQKYEEKYKEYKQKTKDLQKDQRSIKAEIEKTRQEETEAKQQFERTKRNQNIFLQQKYKELDVLKNQSRRLMEQLQRRQQELSQRENKIASLVEEEQMLIQKLRELGTNDSEAAVWTPNPAPEQKQVPENKQISNKQELDLSLPDQIQKIELLLNGNSLDEAQKLYNEARERLIEEDIKNKEFYTEKLWDLYKEISQKSV